MVPIITLMFSFKGYHKMTIGVRSGNIEDNPNQPTTLSVVIGAPIIGLDLVKL